MTRFTPSPEPLSRAQRVEQDRQRETLKPGFAQALTDAAGSEWLPAFFLRQIRGSNFAPDPTWKGLADPDTMAELSNGLADDFVPMLSSAVSLEHAVELKRQALGLQESRERLASLGWGGTALRVGAAILDPVGIAAGVASGGVGWGTRLTRVQRLVRAGLVNAGAETAMEGYFATQDPQRDAGDVMLAAGGGFVMAGGLAAAFGPRAARAAQILEDEATLRPLMVTMGAASPDEFRPDFQALVRAEILTESGRKRFRKTFDPKEAAQRLEARIKASGLDEADPAQKAILDRMRANPEEVLRRYEDPLFDEEVVGGPGPRQPWQMTREEFAGTGDQREATNAFIARQTGARNPKQLLGHYQQKYPELKGVTIGGLESTSQSGPLTKGGVARAVLQDGKLVAKESQIHLTADADLAVTRHEIEHMLDIIHGRLPKGDAKDSFGRFPRHDNFNTSDYLHRSLVKQAIANGEEVPSSVLADYPDLAALAKKAGGKTPPPKPPRGKGPDGEDLPERPEKIGTDLHFTNLSDARSAMGAVRFDMAGALGLSDSPILRTVANALADDSLLKRLNGKAAASIDSAAAWKRRTMQASLSRFYKGYLPAMRQWMQVQGKSGLEGERLFGEAVGLAIQGGTESLKRATPPVKAAAKAVSDSHAELLHVMQRHGVKGSLEVDSANNYLHRIYDQNRFNALEAEIGHDNLVTFYTNAIQSAAPEIEDRLARRMAQGYIRSVKDLRSASSIEKARLFGGDPDQIRALLKRDASDLSPDEIENIVNRLSPTPDADRPSILKRRMIYDEGYTESFTLANGRVRTVRADEVLERNAEVLTRLYASQAVGHSAITAVLEGVSAQTGKKLDSWDDAVKAIRGDLFDRGVAEGQIVRDLKKLDTVHRLIQGLPISDPDSTVSGALRLMQGFNYLRLSGGFGLAQVVELGNIVGEAGLMGTLRNVPAAMSMFKRARAGDVDDSLIDFMENVMGVGVDDLTRRITSRLDDGLTNADTKIIAAEKRIQRMNEWATRLSGFQYIDQFSRRLAVLSALDTLARAAAGKKLSAKRLLSLGLTQDQADRLFRELPKVITTREGMLGRTVQKIDLDKFSDPTLAAQFIGAVDKWASRNIQTNDVGNLSAWMHGEAGRMMIQFRTFALSAWQKQTLRRLQMHEAADAAAALYTMLLASGVYAVQQHLASVGRPDAEEFRAERLSLDRILAAGFSRSGWSSLIPGAFDNTTNLFALREEPMFRYGRYSDLSTVGFLQNPTFNLIDSAVRSTRAASEQAQNLIGAGDFDFTQADARAMSQLLPYRNVLGLNNAVEAFIGNRPKRQE